MCIGFTRFHDIEVCGAEDEDTASPACLFMGTMPSSSMNPQVLLASLVNDLTATICPSILMCCGRRRVEYKGYFGSTRSGYALIYGTCL